MNRFVLKISFRIVLLFVVSMIMSLIPEYANVFGDWDCVGSGIYLKDTYSYQFCNYASLGFHDATTHWGYRHWLFFFMGVCLFIIQIVDIITIIYNHTTKD